MAVKRDFDRMLTIALAVALVLGTATAIRQGFQDSVNKKTTARALPAAYFTDAIGQRHTLSDFKGEVVLVNLWASWCPPCLTELPSLDKLQARLKGRPFRVVAISMNKPPLSSVSGFLEQKDITHLESYQDADGRVAAAWRYDGLPVSFLIDRNGKMVQKFDGPRVWDSGEMFSRISALLAPPSRGAPTK